MKNAMLMGLLTAGLCNFALADDSSPDAKTTTEQFGDWQLLCTQVAAQEQCRISQTLNNQQGQTVSVLNVFQDSNGSKIVELALPLMVDLVARPSIQVDEQESETYPYNLCNGQACFTLVHDEALIDAFKAGQAATVSFKPVSVSESVKIGYSLKGFSRALQALDAK